MKKGLLSLVALLLLGLGVQAQTMRTVLIEEATQASCPPCAGLNPQVQSLVNSNSQTTLFLGYQVSWPGYDPMNLDNPTEVASRISYYGINAAPTVIYSGTPMNQDVSQATINTISDEMSEFAMDLQAAIVNDELIVTGTITAEMEAAGNYKLRIALSESLITIEQAPGGTNGETEYHHVFKKFVGSGPEGIDLGDEWMVGETFEVNAVLDYTGVNIYDYANLEVIAWVQDDNTQFVNQATKMTNISVDLEHEINAIAGDVDGVPAVVCSGFEYELSPTFVLQNFGDANITSADIVYSVNGGEAATYNWTGDLASLGSETIILDPITFTPTEADNTMSLEATNINGGDSGTDGDLDNNTTTVMMDVAPGTVNTLELTLTTDEYADETYWQVAASDGTVIASGGNTAVGLTNIGTGTFPAPNNAGSYDNETTIVETIDLPADDCYTFTITDYFGDGICCDYGDGSYVLRDDQGEIIAAGGDFTSIDDSPFTGDMVVNVVDPTFSASFGIAPNPVKDVAQLTFTLTEAAVTTIDVVNSLGQTVRTQQLGQMPTGQHNYSLDMTNLAPGMYVIKVNAGDIAGTKKVLLAQ